jgi:hypothetical protein
MFEQFGKNLYLAGAYRIEEVEKGKLHLAKHTKTHKREKWSQVKFQVKMFDGGDYYEREYGLFEHIGVVCCHTIKVSNTFVVHDMFSDFSNCLEVGNLSCGILPIFVFQVMEYMGIDEIPKRHILKRCTMDARDVLPEHLQVYQNDHVSTRSFTYRHSSMYKKALGLVRLGDASVEAYEKLHLVNYNCTVR